MAIDILTLRILGPVGDRYDLSSVGKETEGEKENERYLTTCMT